MIEKVFVYGTLRRGEPNRPLIEPLVASSLPARVRGDMYTLGEYPAVIPGGGRVRGELLGFTDLAEALRRMDELESYHGPGDPRNEYERAVVRAELEDGRTEDCYCYLYAKPYFLQRFARPVPGGDWLARRL